MSPCLVAASLPLAEIHLRAGSLRGAVIAAALVAVAGAAFLYAKEKALSPARRMLLGALRAILFLALLAVLLEPVAVLARLVIVPSNLLVLLDVSKSMAIEDPRRSPEDVRDAALALGNLRFKEPELEAALARASRALDRSLDTIARDLPGGGARAAEAREAIEAAREVARARAEDGRGSAGAGAAAAEAVLRLESLAARSSSIEAAGEGAERERDAGELKKIRDEVDALLASLREPSGELPAEPVAARRIDLARAILEHPDLAFLRDAGDHVRIRRFRFGEAVRPAEGEGEPEPAALRDAEPEDDATCLGSALEESVARHAGQSIDGVVVLTDGASNAGLDPLEAARRLAERSVPVFPIGIGLPSPDDIAVRSILVGDAALAGERVPLRAEIAASGFRGRSVEIAAALDGAEVARKALVIDGPRSVVAMEFTAPEKGGAARLEVSVAPVAGEVSTENNRAGRLIEIIDEKIKVLYVEGKPRWEYRYLRAVLLRDPRLDVRFLLTEGDADLPRTSPRHLARFPEEAGDTARFDLVILGNVPARAFTPVQLAWLADLVRKHGGSFLLLAGDQAPAGYVGTPIAELLPVTLSDAGQLEAVEPSAYPAPTEAGLRSGILALDDTGRTEALWSMVRPLHRLPPLLGPKPGAVVLATLSGSRPGDPYPVIAWQRAGTGKSLFVATDSLWRLRYGRGDVFHARFWGQAVRFLTLSRLLGENRRVRIEAATREPRAGERVEVHATALDEAFEPARLPSLSLEVTASHLAGAQTVRLEPVPGAPGLFSGAFVPDREGTYTLRPAGEYRELAKPLDIAATTASREADDADLKVDLLRKLAEISGGRYLEVRDLPSLASVLPAKPAVRTVKEERELWDRWFLLAIVLVAGGIEWFVRRRHDLP